MEQVAEAGPVTRQLGVVGHIAAAPGLYTRLETPDKQDKSHCSLHHLVSIGFTTASRYSINLHIYNVSEMCCWLKQIKGIILGWLAHCFDVCEVLLSIHLHCIFA